ncbi:hypothetical protein QAZ03_10210, partial [Glaesserella parasuis]|uniref:hypothetical protein n=1 Tax=Glaesserella parasuis TaxID=738 RepID=UPI00243692D9
KTPVIIMMIRYVRPQNVGFFIKDSTMTFSTFIYSLVYIGIALYCVKWVLNYLDGKLKDD